MNSPQLISSLNDKKIISINAGGWHTLAMNGKKSKYFYFSISNLFLIQKKMENALVVEIIMMDN